ncbi:MAG TPA: LacI family DNA-binding transcriptional regulator [Nocardioidaceae bacterium]|nr:LacI family DNA-binding transcriptional regulator [Nocardioidaceae bacterium]
MPPSPKRPTIKDIAAATGLSPAAVSYALRGLQVPQETQDRVRNAADMLGYEAHPAARALASGRTGTIGVLCGSLQDLWQQSLSSALGRALLDVGRNALIVDAVGDGGREARMSKHLADQRVDALITIAVDPRSPHWELIAQQLALVSIGDRLPKASTVSEVVFDNDAGVLSSLTTLAEAGHRQVTVLTPGRGGAADRPADRAVLQIAPGLGVDATLVSCPHDLTGATEIALAELQGERRPTAFFCLTDSMAYGVYAAVRDLALTVPDDVSVLGYDDHPVSRLLTPPLSTCRWDIAKIVEAAIDRVVTALDTDRRRRALVLAPEPQMRDSVGPPSGPR